MPPDKFTREVLAPLRQDMEKELEEVGLKHGVYFSFKSISFSSSEASTRLVLRLRNGSQVTSSKELEEQQRSEKMRADFALNCRSFGLSESRLGQPFVVAGKTYTLIGSNSRSQYPIIGRTASGVLYKFTIAQVGTAPHREDDIIMKDIYSAYMHLQPEVLSGDGEAPRSSVDREQRRLNAQLRKLFSEIGRTVSEDAAFDWAAERHL